MRGSILGSGVVHALLLAVLFAVRTPMSVVVPGPDVIQVALMDPAATVASPRPPVPEPPPAPPERIEPVEEQGVKLEPEKPAPRKKEEKPKESRPAPAPTTIPSTSVGSAGLRGDLAVDGASFEFTYYLILIRNRIASNWTPPAGISTGGRPVRAVVYFRIGRSGELGGIGLESPSGVEFFDRSALRAVTISDPLPPLPLGFAGGELGVHFGFEWEAP
jgi:protein TonB